MVYLSIFVSRKQRGASLLEFALAVSIVGILIALLLQRVWYYQGEAERASVTLLVASVRSSLEVKVSQGKLPGRSVNFTMLAEQNPLDLLKAKPANYAGEFFSPSDDDIGEGNWCFDRHEKTLVYLLNNPNSFVDAKTKRLKFKVKLLRLPYNPTKPTGTPSVEGLAFEQVDG